MLELGGISEYYIISALDFFFVMIFFRSNLCKDLLKKARDEHVLMLYSEYEI